MSDTEYIKLKVGQRRGRISSNNKSYIPGRWPGLQRDPLQGEANHPDGKAEEELQRAGWCSCDLPQVNRPHHPPLG